MDWTNPFIIGSLCTGAGIILGMLIMRLLDRAKNGAKALAELREEFDDYRSNVNEHFGKTSSLFEEMTEKYRDVYNHLAAGAQQFGGSDESPPRLELVQPAGQLTASPEAADQPQAEAFTASPVAEFDPASLDESELADLAEPLPAGEPAPAPTEPVKRPEHRFRSMPESDVKPATPDDIAGNSSPETPAAQKDRKESVTPA